MDKVVIDFSKINTKRQVWETLSQQCGFPAWHGKNLDALNDSWVNGGIDKNGPPYDFNFINIEGIKEDLSEFSKEIIEIAKESVTENGGNINIG